jgi:hypothetical protein
MHEVDFLPAAYHLEHAQRRDRPWRVLVLVCFTFLLLAASVIDFQRRQRVRRDLQTIAPLYEKALAQMAALAALENRLAGAGAESELYTYLRHPWPRTQLLDAILGPLPDNIVVERLHLARESIKPAKAANALAKTDPKTEEQERAKLPLAARDLKRLRPEFDLTQTVISVIGSTPDSAALHDYLNQLSKGDLVAKTQLCSIQTVPGDQGGPVLRFTVTVTIRPGYGQPGGPPGANQRGAADKKAGRVTGLQGDKVTG